MKPASRIQQSLQMLTVDDVARKLNLQPDDVISLIDNNQVECFRLGATGDITRILNCQLDNFIASRALTKSRD